MNHQFWVTISINTYFLYFYCSKNWVELKEAAFSGMDAKWAKTADEDMLLALRNSSLNQG